MPVQQQVINVMPMQPMTQQIITEHVDDTLSKVNKYLQDNEEDLVIKAQYPHYFSPNNKVAVSPK